MAAPGLVLRVLRFNRNMCVFVTICFGLILSNQPVLSTTVSNTTKTLAVLYEKGVESYLDERWADCIHHFEHALEDYRNFKQTTVDCRIKCQYKSEVSQPMFPENIENLQYYEKLIKKTLCLLKCKKGNLKMDIQTPITKETEKIFEDLKPYEYLQLCYFQKNLLQKAASSVFTFLVVNPTNDVMQSNLKFYSTLPEVNVHQIINFEAQKYVSLYIHGSEAYDNEDYPSVINYLEESLEDYMKSEEDCRAYCEGSFDQGWFPDFTSSVSNHFTFCLKCKDKCSDKLNTLNGERHEDLLPSHYHFLQFAYYKVGNLKKACESVASYLLFYPADLTMLSNKDIYSKMPKFKLEYFTPRDEAVKYVKRHEFESALLTFIEKEFIFDDPENKDTSANTSSTENEVKLSNLTSTAFKDSILLSTLTNVKLYPPPVMKFEWSSYDHILRKLEKKTVAHKFKTYNLIKDGKEFENTGKIDSIKLTTDEMKRKKERAVKQLMNTGEKKIKVVMGEKELHGKLRFMADGFAEESECQELIQFAQAAAVEGDGYMGNKSPHTDSESFEGVTLGRAALLVYFGLMEPEVLQLYLNISERGRDYVERYFNLKQELYFTYTHLVCRTAIQNYISEKSGMSHAIHADNCNLMENGNCTKEPPAYIWRDFSAIIYLNEDFKGGEFIFASDVSAKNIQSKVYPKCGRLVGFSAGSENLHGVLGVTHGRRCAIGLWFTFNSNYHEIERLLAREVLTQVTENGNVSEQLLRELSKHVVFDSSSQFQEETLKKSKFT